MDVFNFSDDDDDDNEAFQDLLNTPSSVVIPVSTHASSGPRVTSPTSEITSPNSIDGNYSIHQRSSFGRTLQQSGLQQQQQQRAVSPVRSPVRSPARKGGYTSVGLEAEDEVLQQRVSVEMSDLGSSGSARSTPLSLQDGIPHGPTPVGLLPKSPRPAGLVIDVAAGTAGGSSGDAWNGSSSSTSRQFGKQMPGSIEPSPPSEGGQQLNQSQQAERLSPTAIAAMMARIGSNSPRLRAAVPVARLGQQDKAGHHADGQSVIGKG